MFINIHDTLLGIGASKTKYINHFLPTPYVGPLTMCFEQKNNENGIKQRMWSSQVSQYQG